SSILVLTFYLQAKVTRMRRAVFKNNFKNLDRGTDSVILLALIKGSNLRLEICVCSVVSTVETSGTTWKW
ncbi:hypothetical protein L0P42_14540, partial [Fusicatenibacter saccharivorans]|uniref:hypothetical protein n=1 Tax=Fusicatenibacter saccharivorans TaxID=1150298 RepID=UPI001EDF40EE